MTPIPADYVERWQHTASRLSDADRLSGAGFRGVLAPSAALPGTVNLTLFGRRLAVPWDYPEDRLMASFIPAKRLAIGRPPEELLALVRQRDEHHSPLEARRRTRTQASHGIAHGRYGPKAAIGTTWTPSSRT